jgi:hypothetical protein
MMPRGGWAWVEGEAKRVRREQGIKVKSILISTRLLSLRKKWQ